MGRPPGAVVLAGLVWGFVLASMGHAQGHDELARLRTEVTQLHSQGKYTDAAPVAERYVAIARQKHGEQHAEFAEAISWLGSVYRDQGRIAEAEPLLKRSLAIVEKALGPDHATVAESLSYLANLYRDQGRYAEAEPLYRRSLAVREKLLGLDHSGVGVALNNLAGLMGAQGRIAEAELLFKRSLAIAENALGPVHLDLVAPLNNLAELYREQRRFAEAEALSKRSLTIAEKTLGPDHLVVARLLNNVALTYGGQRRFAEAELLYRRSLAIAEKLFGPDHSDVGTKLGNLATLYRAQGDYAKAEALYTRSLAIAEKTLGPDHPHASVTLNNLATISADQGDWPRAAEYWRRSTALIKRRAERGLVSAAQGSSKVDAQRSSWKFTSLVKATYRLAAEGLGSKSAAADMFETAQWVSGSGAADSLAQMATRSAKGSPKLALVVREQQDLVREWEAADKLLIAAKSEPPPKRRVGAEKALSDRLVAINASLAEISRRLSEEFPEYAALASPTAATVADVQALLGVDEGLVLFLDTPEWPLVDESFVWVLTKSNGRWVRLKIGTTTLTREVRALRCGLDGDAWGEAGRQRCAEALGMDVPQKVPSPLPFDHVRAHKLYAALFGQVQDLIKGKHLLIVPSGPLTQLPFQVLVTKAPAEGVRPGGSDPRALPSVVGGKDGKHKGRAMGSDRSDPQGLTPASGDHRAAAWLAREHATTVLPAVSSLKALRRVARPSTAPRPMIGVGNPAARRPRRPPCGSREARPRPAALPGDVGPMAGDGRRSSPPERGAGGDARRPGRPGAPQGAGSAARDRRRAVRRGPGREGGRCARHPPRRRSHRARSQTPERQRRAGQVPHGPLRHPRHPRRRAQGHA